MGNVGIGIVCCNRWCNCNEKDDGDLFGVRSESEGAVGMCCEW